MDPRTLQIDDTYVLCDAGGGTTDVVTYAITAVKPSVHVKEAVPGTGGRCGSTYLNRIFRQFIENKFSKNKGWSEETLNEAMQRFETGIKRTFRGEPNEEFMIPVPGIRDTPSKEVKRGRFRMTGADLLPIFQVVIREVIKLVKGQILATGGTVKGILLVGGFGQSPFLRETMRKEISNISVIQPPNGWTAVVRGALIKGLAEVIPSLTRIKIDSRLARKHYGVAGSVKFDPKSHDSRKK
jgi:molecular chaperone DnaK (HSP70)